MPHPLLALPQSLLRSYRRINYVRWLILGLGVGVLSGFAAVGFFAGIEFLKSYALQTLAGLNLPTPAGESLFHGEPGPYRPWLAPVFTTTVGLVTGLLVARFIPETVESGTDGTDAMIKAFHHEEGLIKPKTPIIRGLTSILTIASGGSAGREGPISQIGAGIGSYVAQRFKLSAKERRILLLAGAAGGLGAIFRAPLGGALTAVEVIYREDFEAEAILPSVLSSVTAYTIFTFFFGTDPMFGIPQFEFHNPIELIFYAVLAAFCALTGWFYVHTFGFMKHRVFGSIRERLGQRKGIVISMTLGGLTMGVIGFLFPQALTGGYGWLEDAILGELSIMLMLGIIVVKTVATSVTIGSGMSGGMFAPALFVGGMSGGVVGALAHSFYPNVVTAPGGYVLVGMAAFFAGVANAPIGPLLMVCELTQGYGLLAPLMLASALCLVLGRKLLLYENQVNNKFESPAHITDATINILERLTVAEHYRPGVVTTLEESTSLKALTDIIAGTNEFVFPVRNAEGEFTGVLAIQDVREVLFEDALYEIILVKELARKPVALKLEDDLYTALLAFVDVDLSQMPVVDEAGEMVGLIDRDDVFHAYSTSIRAIHASKEA